MLVIGYGNSRRGDDAAGILVAESLRKCGIRAETCEGDAAALMEAWAGDQDVIIVDAVVTGAPVGTVHVWENWPASARATRTSSTHGLGVAEAVELSRVLNRLPARLRIYGIEALQFEPGAQISRELDSGIEEAVRRIAEDVTALG